MPHFHDVWAKWWDPDSTTHPPPHAFENRLFLIEVFSSQTEIRQHLQKIQFIQGAKETQYEMHSVPYQCFIHICRCCLPAFRMYVHHCLYNNGRIRHYSLRYRFYNNDHNDQHEGCCSVQTFYLGSMVCRKYTVTFFHCLLFYIFG